MAKTRYYTVRATLPKLVDGSGVVQEEHLYLIDATSAPAARLHVTNKFVSAAEIADAKKVAELMGRGVKPETAES